MAQWDVYAYHSRSWNQSGYWRSDNWNVYQGNYGWGNHMGCWFYGNYMRNYQNHLWANGVYGGWVTGAWVYLHRAGSGGSSGALGAHLWTTWDYDPNWGTWPHRQSYIGNVGNIPWNWQGWLALPAWAAQELSYTTAGLALYTDNGTGYSIYHGMNVQPYSGLIRFEYWYPPPPPAPTPAAPAAPPPPQILTSPPLPAGRVGQYYDMEIVGGGGTPPYAWWQVDGQLPPGLNLHASTGNLGLSGTPTVPSGNAPPPDVNNWGFTVGMWESGNRTTQKYFWMGVYPQRPQITTPGLPDLLPDAVVGQPYSHQLTATGSAPFTWNVSSSALPGGLGLSSSGLISGMPSVATYAEFNITLADNFGQSVNGDFGIDISPSVASAPTGVSAAAGDASARVSWAPPADSGGTAITGYVVAATPSDAEVSVDAGITSVVVEPLSNGTEYRFTVVALNSVGSSPPSAPSEPVTPEAFRIVTESLPPATYGQAYRIQLSADGGVEAYSWSITAGELPEGLVLDRRSGVIRGTPVRPEEPELE